MVMGAAPRAASLRLPGSLMAQHFFSSWFSRGVILLSLLVTFDEWWYKSVAKPRLLHGSICRYIGVSEGFADG